MAHIDYPPPGPQQSPKQIITTIFIVSSLTILFWHMVGVIIATLFRWL